MSDVYPVRDPLVILCDPPENKLNYVKKQRQGEFNVVCGLGLKQEALRQWYKLKKKYARNKIHQHC